MENNNVHMIYREVFISTCFDMSDKGHIKYYRRNVLLCDVF